jgi:DNA-directed RNA polymerase specialized sigma24 family protein
MGNTATGRTLEPVLVELRFFTGLNERETAEALGISLSTVKRDWNFAKARLFDQLTSTR